jgi:DNA-binding NtrC family response regulator
MPLRGAPSIPPAAGPVPTWEEAERTLIGQALQAAAGNRSEAARLLQVERQRLLRKIKKYGLDKAGAGEDEKPA